MTLDREWMEAEARVFDDCPATNAEIQARQREYLDTYTDESWWRWRVALDSRMQFEPQSPEDIRATYEGVKWL